ncbi:MAG: glycosyltransferase family 2 protein [Pseudomonadota bacterium]
MSIRKSLIKLANRMESAWQHVDFSASPVMVPAGWYVTEFVVQGAMAHTPRIIVERLDGKKRERELIGFHSGRNRMLIYLPAGRMEAVSESIEFVTLACVPWWEGRARILLICFRYLLDFFNPLVLARMIAMQFKNSFDLSTDLLQFYMPPAETAAQGYLNDLVWWDRFRNYSAPLKWWNRNPKIAVVIEEKSQRAALEDLLVVPDGIILSSECQNMAAKDYSEFDYVVPLAKTEILRKPAIMMIKRAIRKAIRQGQKPTLIYTDHDYYYDQLKGDKVMEPVFKPQPSAAYLHCFNYIGSSVIVARSEIAATDVPKLFDEEYLYRFALNQFSNLSAVVQVPEVLFQSSRQTVLHTPEPDTQRSHWPNIDWQRKEDHNVLSANPDWQSLPSVDLIIPTRDGLAVLQPCIESILAITDYPDFHIIIVDNGSEKPATLEFFARIQEDPRVRVVAYPGEFNYSAINNFAIAQGKSEYVAMINNDIEAIHADWLRQMMVWATQEQVGIVGAKLLFSNGSVQHAGVTIGMGNAAGHIHRLEQGDAPGYQNRCIATQNMMAVTAACLITPRALFEELGGLDEQHLKVAYNDIDYCLRVEQLGWDIIWTPEARLYHHESVSRGDDMSDKHIERYFYELGTLQKRWKTKGFVDKYYSKHLRISDEGVYPQVKVQGQDQLRYL